MNIDLKNTKVRNAFIVLGVMGVALVFTPLIFEDSRFQDCIDRVGSQNSELCQLPQHLYSEAVINPMYTKLAGVAAMILGCLFIVAAGGYLATKLIKNEVSKMRSDVSRGESLKSEVKGVNGKSLVEMKQLFDEKLITADEFEAYKKSYLEKL